MNPGTAGLLAGLKEALRAGEPEGAAIAYTNYLAAEPRDALAWTDFAGLLVSLQRPEEALEACRKSLALKPGQVAALCHLGDALLQLERVDEAEAIFRKAAAAEPGRIGAWLSLAKCFLKKRDLPAARRALETILAQEPANPGAHQYLSQIFYEQGLWPEFRAELDRYERHDPSSAYLEYERGFENLLQGVLPLGWQQWEARLRVPGCIQPERTFQEPRWDGEAFPGRTLLVHYEQGFGDTIMLVRFLPRVKALGGKVLLLVQPRLADLVATCEGADQVIPQGEPLPPFDLQISLYSLPAVFRMGLDSLATDVPYLGIPAQVPNRREIAERLAVSEGRTRVGLAWAGYKGHPRDAERSLPTALLGRLGAIPGVAWHGFQLGLAEEPGLPDYLSLAPCLSNFSDTAYALSGMDLVITVDTALAHLAGALGIPTLLLVTCIPDFRWLLGREDSPWYPTLRIYRQPKLGDWPSVMDAVVQDLSA